MVGLVGAACGDDGGGGGVSGVAHAVHGASVSDVMMLLPQVPAPATDGTWYVTPDQAKVTIERINFEGADTTQSTGADLTNCVVTFDKSTPALMSLLDCPFSIPPGTYRAMTVFVNGTFEVLVNDAVNDIYTDPAATTKLSSTAPSGGATPVPYTRPLGATGIEQQFATPLTLAEGDTLSLAIVLDAIHTLHVDVTDSGASLAFINQDQIPVNIFPTLTTPGVARYLTTANTAESYNDSLVLANIVRVYYDAGSTGAALYAFTEQTAGTINGCSTPAPAYPVDPAMATPNGAGGKLGGWLGRDFTLTTCWVVPNMPDYSQYRAYFTLGDTANVGDTATLSCEQTTAPTPPSSGSTYSSGCPAITADATATLMLVAQ